MPKKGIFIFGVCKIINQVQKYDILQSFMLLVIEANVTFAINNEILWKPNNMHLNVSWHHYDVTYDVNFQYGGHQHIRTLLVNGTSTLKSNFGDQKACKKKNLSWLFGVDRKIRPLGSLFGITRLSLVMLNSDPRTEFSIHTSHPWKILIFFIRTAKTLIRPSGCPGWSESSLGAYDTLLVLSWGSSYDNAGQLSTCNMFGKKMWVTEQCVISNT